MKGEYDLSKLKSRKNPYTLKLIWPPSIFVAKFRIRKNPKK
jgi:hypothetical protein